MIGSLAEGLAGVVVGEVAQANRQRPGDGPRHLQQQHQRQQAPGPLAGFTESVGEACNRALAMAITASSHFARVLSLSRQVLHSLTYTSISRGKLAARLDHIHHGKVFDSVTSCSGKFFKILTSLTACS